STTLFRSVRRFAGIGNNPAGSLNPLPQAGLNQGFSGVSVNPSPLPSRLARAASAESGKPCAVMRYLPLAAHPYCLLHRGPRVGRQNTLLNRYASGARPKMLANSLSTTRDILLITPLLWVLAGCDARGQTDAADSPPPPEVEVAEVHTQPVTLWGDFRGPLEAPQ